MIWSHRPAHRSATSFSQIIAQLIAAAGPIEGPVWPSSTLASLVEVSSRPRRGARGNECRHRVLGTIPFLLEGIEVYGQSGRLCWQARQPAGLSAFFVAFPLLSSPQLQPPLIAAWRENLLEKVTMALSFCPGAVDVAAPCIRWRTVTSPAMQYIATRQHPAPGRRRRVHPVARVCRPWTFRPGTGSPAVSIEFSPPVSRSFHG